MYAFTRSGHRIHIVESVLSVQAPNGRSHAYVGPESVSENDEVVTMYGRQTLCGRWCDVRTSLTPPDHQLCLSCKKSREAGEFAQEFIEKNREAFRSLADE